MTREIKFRAWDKRRLEMIYWDLFGTSYDESMYLWVDNYGKRYEENLIVMEYTGLKDKNGVGIYEGDIALCVALSSSSTVYIKDIRNIPVQVSAWPKAYGNGNGSCEVIGNICENPELLEVGND